MRYLLGGAGMHTICMDALSFRDRVSAGSTLKASVHTSTRYLAGALWRLLLLRSKLASCDYSRFRGQGIQCLLIYQPEMSMNTKHMPVYYLYAQSSYAPIPQVAVRLQLRKHRPNTRARIRNNGALNVVKASKSKARDAETAEQSESR